MSPLTYIYIYIYIERKALNENAPFLSSETKVSPNLCL